MSLSLQALRAARRSAQTAEAVRAELPCTGWPRLVMWQGSNYYFKQAQTLMLLTIKETQHFMKPRHCDSTALLEFLLHAVRKFTW